MPREVGSRVMTCSCGGKVVGMPGQTRKCSFCGAKVRVTKKPAKPVKRNAVKVVAKNGKKAPTKKTPAKKPVIKAAKKPVAKTAPKKAAPQKNNHVTAAPAAMA